MEQKLEARGVQTLVSFEDGANSLSSKPPGSMQPERETGGFARGWSKFADFEATWVDTAQTRNRWFRSRMEQIRRFPDFEATDAAQTRNR